MMGWSEEIRFCDVLVIGGGGAGLRAAIAAKLCDSMAKGENYDAEYRLYDLRGTFHVMRAIFPHLKKPGASVINISAPQALIPMIGQIHVF